MALSTRGVEISHNLTQLNDATPTPNTPPILLVFINGLMLPSALWKPTLDLLRPHFTSHPTPIYALTYDRYGQGASRSPTPDWTPDLHPLTSTTEELDSLLTTLLPLHFPPPTPTPQLIYIAHSIGVALIRLHNTLTSHPHHLGTAYLFLDSNISNTDFISLLPDPSSPTFDPGTTTLPPDSTLTDLTTFRQRTAAMFHPTVRNAEGLDRTTVAELVPHADQSKLRSSEEGGKGPWLTVVGHDPEAFAEEGLKMSRAPKGLTRRYMQPAWDGYNEGLLEVGGDGRVKGLVIAEGAGHFVQRDTPGVVVGEVVELVEKVVGGC